jgi:MoxR-like ATPase
MGRALIITATDARTETRDLLWSLDAVARLAEAQVMGTLAPKSVDDVRARLDVRCFVQPGALWWAFDWTSAQTQAQGGGEGACVKAAPHDWQPAQGTVVLVDEIDKADSSVPNGLLDALGHRSFGTPWGEAVSMSSNPPLVVITTNEERTLPDAFLRRCFVLHLELPAEGPELVERLMRYGRAHFPERDEGLLRTAADLLARDRRKVWERGLSLPGLAEYIDLLAAVTAEWDDGSSPADRLETVAKFVLDKHPPDRDMAHGQGN